MSENDKPAKYIELGTRLKFLREQWKQTINDVSSTLEIDEKTLKAFESGKVAPSHDTLDMLISHFLLTEDQAQDLRDMVDDANEDVKTIEDVLSKQMVMFMPIDNRVVYTDGMQATVNDSGVILQFMQQTGTGQSLPISRVGMSRQHAERVIEVLQNTLNHKPSTNK